MNFFGTGQQVSVAERELRPLLFDEGCQVLSTFEMNKVASLTYGDLVCDEIFELVQGVLSRPLDHTPLTLQKTLVMLKHILIYGSEKCVNSGYGIAKIVEYLQTFNTVLAMQQQQGAMAFLQRIQGGGVDRGGPVREAATQVHSLLSNINELQRIRNASASKDSLVPIGDDKIAFLTDEVRHFLLKKRIEEQEKIHIKSNLVKSEGGFGGGYSAKDGKNVVGAAHGIEEMIKIAARDKKKFSDDGPIGPTPEEKILEELAAEARAAQKQKQETTPASTVDLLGSFNPTPSPQPVGEIDLLDFGGSNTTQTPVRVGSCDLLGVHDFTASSSATTNPTYTDDLLSLAGAPDGKSLWGATETSLGGGAMNGNLLGTTSVLNTPALSDPFGPVSSHGSHMTPSLLYNNPDPFASHGNTTCQVGGLTTMTASMAISTGTKTTTNAVMGSNQDRFAALDMLAEAPQLTKVTTLDAKLAENRILGGTTSPSANTLVSNNFGSGSTTLNNKPLSTSSQPSYKNPSETFPSPSLNYYRDPVALTSAAFGMQPLAMGVTPVAPAPMVAPTSGRVAAKYGDTEEEENNPWVMGGTVGAGLQPLGPAPAVPPPPPPTY